MRSMGSRMVIAAGGSVWAYIAAAALDLAGSVNTCLRAGRINNSLCTQACWPLVRAFGAQQTDVTGVGTR